jgi:hypothetical protein
LSPRMTIKSAKLSLFFIAIPVVISLDLFLMRASCVVVAK